VGDRRREELIGEAQKSLKQQPPLEAESKVDPLVMEVPLPFYASTAQRFLTIHIQIVH
jgi:hypothetical protein